MLSAILGIFIWSLLAPIVARRLPHVAGWVLAVVPAALTFWFAGFVPEIASGGTVREVVAWIPGLGVNLSFALDGLSLLFALLISGVGALVLVYAGGYLPATRSCRASSCSSVSWPPCWGSSSPTTSSPCSSSGS